jgi:hypothetical protein
MMMNDERQIRSGQRVLVYTPRLIMEGYRALDGTLYPTALYGRIRTPPPDAQPSDPDNPGELALVTGLDAERMVAQVEAWLTARPQ